MPFTQMQLFRSPATLDRKTTSATLRGVHCTGVAKTRLRHKPEHYMARPEIRTKYKARWEADTLHLAEFGTATYLRLPAGAIKQMSATVE